MNKEKRYVVVKNDDGEGMKAVFGPSTFEKCQFAMIKDAADVIINNPDEFPQMNFPEYLSSEEAQKIIIRAINQEDLPDGMEEMINADKDHILFYIESLYPGIFILEVPGDVADAYVKNLDTAKEDVASPKKSELVYMEQISDTAQVKIYGCDNVLSGWIYYPKTGIESFQMSWNSKIGKPRDLADAIIRWHENNTAI